MSTGRTAAIVGGGLAGLSAACTLAARGWKVRVFERNAWMGGKAAELKRDGYRFDMGPTILLMPSVLRRIFGEAGRDISDYLDLRRLSPQWRCFYSNGNILNLHEDRAEMDKQFKQMKAGEVLASEYRHLLNQSARMSKLSEKYFFWKSVGSLADTFDLKTTFQPSVLRDLHDMRIGRTLGSTVRRWISNPQVAQMVDHFTQYVGSAPALSPAVLLGIADMQLGEGIWYPMGGTRAVPTALEKLGRELGVEFVIGCGIREIKVRNGEAKAVVTDSGEEFEADAVVSNSDAVLTHRELLGPDGRRFESRRKYEPACSGVVMYLGLRKRYEHLAHHNFVFSESAEAEFHDIYRRGEPAKDPTCYVCCPSVTEAAVAPSGGEALYILVHTPYLHDGQNWQTLYPQYRKAIIKKLASAGMEDIESRIAVEDYLTPQSIQDRYHVWKGAIYGLASHGRLNGAFKPANRSPDIRGLYLAGGSAHPGPGMPMVLMSGWIAADTLSKDMAA
jgi:diapolycopene oxygenase